MEKVQCKRCRVVYRVGYYPRTKGPYRCEMPDCAVPYTEVYQDQPARQAVQFISRQAGELEQMREYHGPQTQPADGK